MEKPIKLNELLEWQAPKYADIQAKRYEWVNTHGFGEDFIK